MLCTVVLVQVITPQIPLRRSCEARKAQCSAHHSGIISEVAEVMGDVESARIRVDWMDRLIGEIHKERECNELV